MLDRLKRLDMYGTIDEDFQRRTASGATVTLATLAVICLFGLLEAQAYLWPELESVSGVAPQQEVEAGLVFDVYVERVPCGALRVEVHDEDSSHHVELSRRVKSVPVGARSRKAADGGKGKGADKSKERTAMETFSRDAGVPVEYGTEEARELKAPEKVRAAWKAQHGCRLSAELLVPTVPGNAQIVVDLPALERALEGAADMPPLEELDTTHTVERFEFVPPSELSVANGGRRRRASLMSKMFSSLTARAAPSSASYRQGGPLESFNYHVQAVQVFQPGNVNCTYDDAYSFSKFKAPGQARLDFHYEFSPISVLYRPRPVSLFRTLSYLFSAIGGIYTLSLFVNAAVGGLAKRKAMEGKLG